MKTKIYVVKSLLGMVLLLGVPVASAQQPDNVTLELSFSPTSAYIDGQQYSDTYVTTSSTFGYVSTSQPLGIVSYGEIPIQISFVDSESYSITQNTSSGDTGEFLVPFTSDGISSIENRQNLIESGSLMDKLNPALSFDIGAERVIRVSYNFPYQVAEFIGPETGIDEVLVRNRIHTGNRTELTVKTE